MTMNLTFNYQNELNKIKTFKIHLYFNKCMYMDIESMIWT